MSLRQIRRRSAALLRDGGLLQALRAELNHELSSSPPQSQLIKSWVVMRHFPERQLSCDCGVKVQPLLQHVASMKYLQQKMVWKVLETNAHCFSFHEQRKEVRIAQRFHDEVYMHQSALVSTAVSSIQKYLRSQPPGFLSGVDVLRNASSALSSMSKGVAALSMDKKFIQNRQKKDSKSVEDIGDVIGEEVGALAKGFFRGVTGILTKPLEGAKSFGVEGFAQGVGKGLIGAAVQPMGGVLDLLSKTTEEANAVRMKISSTITSEEQLLRRRLPRVIGGDNLLRPYDEYKAAGQVKNLQFHSACQHYDPKKAHPARDPCSVLWDVLLGDMVTMELIHGKKDIPGSLPSRLILHLQIRSIEPKETARVINCTHGSQQATKIYSASTGCLWSKCFKGYLPLLDIRSPLYIILHIFLQDMQKRKVPRPYTPCSSVVCPQVYPKEDFGNWVVHDDKGSVPISSAFGTIPAQPQPGKEP
ncbi:hypothetical protein COCNU_04G006790 [Cocos nucifera]|uniref:Vacuolar protein sorting-associated protein 13 DH-like domain-containing protein n=1 Tax=Cocos nucifera TaxID=13894 RepID=A0A8K0N059_COCNU|nr:hypothetical protein COCNU_04G006790 [Cocos nucifera]